MSFWDRFILSIYLSFRAPALRGLPAASRILALAFRERLFRLKDLNDLSLLLLVATCPRGYDLRDLVDPEFAARELDLESAVPYLRGLWDNVASHQDDVAMLHFYSHGNPPQKAQAVGAMQARYGPRVREFAARLHLLLPASLFEWSRNLIAYALAKYARIPPDTIDFVSYLFFAVPNQIHGAAPPDYLRHPVPQAFAKLIENEQWLVQACLDYMGADERILLYLSFYGRMTVSQITQLYGLANDWTEDQIVTLLTQCWEKVLPHVRQAHRRNGSS